MKLVSKKTTKTSRGILSKGWYESKGELYLIKGNTEGGLEPYSEVMASRIGRLLGLPIVEYRLVESKNYKDVKGYGIDHFSICKSYMTSDIAQTVPILRYLDALWGRRVTDYWSIYHRTNLSIEFLYRMLIFDAFIGNVDRHLNNWDILVDNKGKVIEAPIIDNGASLLAWYTPRELKKTWVIGPDKSKPFKETHREQVALIKRMLKGQKIYPNIGKQELMTTIIRINQDIFQHLGRERTEQIIKYLNARYVYLEGVMESV